MDFISASRLMESFQIRIEIFQGDPGCGSALAHRARGGVEGWKGWKGLKGGHMMFKDSCESLSLQNFRCPQNHI